MLVAPRENGICVNGVANAANPANWGHNLMAPAAQSRAADPTDCGLDQPTGHYRTDTDLSLFRAHWSNSVIDAGLPPHLATVCLLTVNARLRTTVNARLRVWRGTLGR